VGSRNQDVRALLEETLLRHLPAERERRAAGVAGQQARLRASPASRELQAFKEEVRQKARQEEELAARQEKALQQVFAQLGVTDAAEQKAPAPGWPPPGGRAPWPSASPASAGN
jgi:hypothetical protein